MDFKTEKVNAIKLIEIKIWRTSILDKQLSADKARKFPQPAIIINISNKKWLKESRNFPNLGYYTNKRIAFHRVNKCSGCMYIGANFDNLSTKLLFNARKELQKFVCFRHRNFPEIYEVLTKNTIPGPSHRPHFFSTP